MSGRWSGSVVYIGRKVGGKGQSSHPIISSTYSHVCRGVQVLLFPLCKLVPSQDEAGLDPAPSRRRKDTLQIQMPNRALPPVFVGHFWVG